MIKVVKKQNFPVLFLENTVALKQQPEQDPIESLVHHIENLDEGQVGDALTRATEFRGQNTFYMGGLLSLMQENKWYKTHGFSSFKQYVEEETGLATSTAYDYIGIYNNLVESGIRWSQIEHLGWTKIRVFSKHLSKENLSEWADVAESKSVVQLKEFVKGMVADVLSYKKPNPYLEVSTHADTCDADCGQKKPVSEEGSSQNTPAEEPNGNSSLVVNQKTAMVTPESASNATKTLIFKLHPDQEETVMQAMEIAKEEGNTEYNSPALDYICMEFIESRVGMH